MDLSLIRKKLGAIQSQGEKKEKKEKIDYTKYLWKPKEVGKYQIRIVPSKLDISNPFKEVFIHYGIAKFPIYALTNWGEKDPIVEFSEKLKNCGETKEEKSINWKLSKKLEPKLRIFAPIIVRGEEDKGVRLWEFGKEIYSDLLTIADDEDYGDYTDINEGRDFTVNVIRDKVGNNENALKQSIQVKPKTTKLSSNKEEVSSWLENQPNILEIQYKSDYEKLKAILKKFLSPDDKEDNSSNQESQEETSESKAPKISKNTKKFDKLFGSEEESSQD